MVAKVKEGFRWVLVVEDDFSILEAIKSLLESEGYTVVGAMNGQQALDVLRSVDELPEVILLDIMMPVMDGFEFRAAQFRDDRLAAIPIILMTADGNIEAKRDKMSASGCIKKPLQIEDILKQIETYFV